MRFGYANFLDCGTQRHMAADSETEPETPDLAVEQEKQGNDIEINEAASKPKESTEVEVVEKQPQESEDPKTAAISLFGE